MTINLKHVNWFDNKQIKLIKTTPEIEYTIEKNCDILKITHIIFDTDPNLFTLDDEIIIRTPKEILYKSSLNLLSLINQATKSDNKYILPVDFFDFYLISTHFTEFILKMTIHNDKFKNISFITENFFLKNNEKKNYGDHYYTIKYPTSICKTINSEQVTFIINSCHSIDGYYIEANVDNIKSLSINLYNEELQQELDNDYCQLMNYDKPMINLFLKKINDKLFYVPLNSNKIAHFNFNLLSQGLNPMNHTICIKQSFIIKINFDIGEEKIALHTYNYNRLRYSTGICSLQYVSAYVPDVYCEIMFENFKFGDKMYNGKVIIINSSIDQKYDEFSENILELKIIKLNKNLINLPLNLKKLEIYNKANDVVVKYPFGCEYIEENIEL
jgi:hypothetical protein